MGGIVFAGVASHGWPLIPALSEDAAGAMQTRAAMEDLGRRCASARPDVVIVATPHGVRVEDAVCLAAVARGAGAIRREGRSVEFNVPVDQRLTDAIAVTARERGLPVALASFGGIDRHERVISLDWGVMVPLWFVGHGRNLVGYGDVLGPAPVEDLGPPVVIITPSFGVPWPALVEFGVAVAEAAERDGRRVAFIASCDWAHTHGTHPAAAEIDTAVVEALNGNDLDRLLMFDERQVAATGTDGLWQTLMLAGVMRRVPMRGGVLSYEVPPAFNTGLLVASFAPV